MTVLLVTEEISANMYARRLAGALADLGERVVATSDLGDPALGVACIADPAPLSAFGLVETLAGLSAHLRKYRAIAGFIRRERPAAVIAIDYGGFNMFLARRLGAECPFYYFIPPKVWAWGRFRTRALARDFRRIFTIFPFEAPLFAAAGGAAEFVGHPLVELVAPFVGRPKDPDLVALLPGSRPREIDGTLGPLAEAVALLAEAEPGLRFALLLADRVERGPIEAALAGRAVEFVTGEAARRETLARASVALAASGTAVLEAALLDTPVVALYRVAPLTAWIARRLLAVRRVTLPNIILGRDVVPELLQADLNADEIFRRARALLRNASLRRYTLAAFAELRERMRGGGDVFAAVAAGVAGDRRAARTGAA